MQCSGIHRGLGVHISQVRSTTLDTWLPEQVRRMRLVGNVKSNLVYEAKLPKTYKRPSHTRDGQAAVKRFTYMKYVQKKWYDSKAAKQSAKVEENTVVKEPKRVELPKADKASTVVSTGAEAPLGDLLLSTPPNVMDNDGAAQCNVSVNASQRNIMDELEGLSLVAPSTSCGGNEASTAAAPAPASATSWEASFAETPAAPAGNPESSMSNAAGLNQSSVSVSSIPVHVTEVQRRQSSKEDIMSLYDSMGSSASFASANPMDNLLNQRAAPLPSFGGQSANPHMMMNNNNNNYSQQQQQQMHASAGQSFNTQFNTQYQGVYQQSYQSSNQGASTQDKSSTFYNSF